MSDNSKLSAATRDLLGRAACAASSVPYGQLEGRHKEVAVQIGKAVLEAVNARRIELFEKRHRHGLNFMEYMEWSELQPVVLRMAEAVNTQESERAAQLERMEAMLVEVWKKTCDGGG